VRYAFIRDHSDRLPITALCALNDLHPSGYYAWLKHPKSDRQLHDEKLSGLVKQFWLESGGVLPTYS